MTPHALPGAVLALILAAAAPVPVADPVPPHWASTAQAPAVPAAAPSQSGCQPASSQPVPDGQPIAVTLPPYPDSFVVGRIPPAWWRTPPEADPSWQLALRGFTWVQPLAQRAWQDGDYQSLAALVEQVVTFQAQDPDPGTSAAGWDEGTALRRLETLNCLYWLARDAGLSYGHLRASMAATVAVQTCPRYYGPPCKPVVHNHGLMANLRILRAGVLTGNAGWRALAIDRMTREAPQAWSPRGVTWEQSSTYHHANIVLWDQAADAIAAQAPGSPAPAAIRAATRRADVAWQWMTEPDGNIVQIGDADLEPGHPNPRNAARVFEDDAAGWVVGRWSWSDPRTTYYTLRYGPPLRAHGHQDRPAVTFTTLGARVLVGPGRYTYDTASPWHAYQASPAAHNASYTDGRLDPTKAVTLAASKVQATAHAWTTTDTLYGRTHTRTVNVNGAAHALRLIDTYAGTGTHRQALHLAPQWALRSRAAHRLVFAHPSGLTATITTTGTVSSVVRGLTSPIQGWVFPKRAARTANYAVLIRSNVATLDTTVAVG